MTPDKMDNSFEHAWRYFELHAGQRISLIRYYVVFLTFYVTTLGYLIVRFDKPDYNEEIFGIVLSVFFLIITILFWFIDARNRTLIHLAEDSLRKFEKDSPIKNPHCLFQLEKKKSVCCIRHTHCFWTLFSIAIITAFFVILFCVHCLLK